MKRIGIIMLYLAGISVSAAQSYKIVGYYSMKAAIENEYPKQLRYLTHINLWFLNPDSTGHFHLDQDKLKSFIAKAHKKNTKVLFSIGGGSKQPQYHWLLQPENREALIDQLIHVVTTTHADGIDVDLEGSDIGAHYESFVLSLGEKLKAKQKLITAAVAIYYKDKMTDKVLAAYDFVNVMAYDRTGPWRPEKPGPHATFTHAVEDIRYFVHDRKLPSTKVTLGVPFYGYAYGKDDTGHAVAISMGYKKIIESYPQARYTDEYLLPDGKILYYNGIETIKQKAAYAKKHAAGIMIWQILGDAPGKNSLLKLIYKEGRRN